MWRGALPAAPFCGEVPAHEGRAAAPDAWWTAAALRGLPPKARGEIRKAHSAHAALHCADSAALHQRCVRTETQKSACGPTLSIIRGDTSGCGGRAELWRGSSREGRERERKERDKDGARERHGPAAPRSARERHCAPPLALTWQLLSTLFPSKAHERTHTNTPAMGRTFSAHTRLPLWLAVYSYSTACPLVRLLTFSLPLPFT